MKIKLISVSVHKGIEVIVQCKKHPTHIMIPSLGPIILAALTPEEFEVKLINDESEEIDYNEDVDLVGISFITPTSTRAYTIAEQFKA